MREIERGGLYHISSSMEECGHMYGRWRGG